jgi:hypothetical protein
MEITPTYEGIWVRLTNDSFSAPGGFGIARLFRESESTRTQKMNFKSLVLLPLMAAIASAQVVIPDGTKLRLRLDQTLTSATADEGQTVELSVAETVTVDGVAIIQEGSRATGTVVLAQEKRRMGRAGKLDFSVDRVRAVNGQWLPVRYTLTKKQGDSKAVSTGVITAGVAVVFWPAAPFVLMRHGKDTTINKGTAFDVFIDGNHNMNAAPQQQAPSVAAAPPATPMLVATPQQSVRPAVVPVSTNAFVQPGVQAGPSPNAGAEATVTIASNDPGADIEINGAFVGSAPTAVKLAPGQYIVTVRKGTQVWQRTLQVNAGSSVSLNAVFEDGPVVRRSRMN